MQASSRGPYRPRLPAQALERGMPTRKADVGSAKGKDEWVPDREAAACTKCGAKFTLRRRKHHCRLCGGIFCGPCSEARTSRDFNGVTMAKPQRACMDCYAELRRKPLGWGSASADGSGSEAQEPEPEPETEPEPAAFEPEPDVNSSEEVGGSAGPR